MADGNRPLQYLRYAIGEIILVVIGILIALQINNWNETKKNEKLELRYIADLISDLQKDSIALVNLTRETNETARMKVKLKAHFNGKPVEPDSLIIFFESQWSPFRVFNPTKITVEEMKNSGRLDLISNQEIKRKVIALYNQYDLFEQDELLFVSSTRQLQEMGKTYLYDIDNPTVQELTELFKEKEIRNNIRVNYASGRNKTAIETQNACNELLDSLKIYLNKKQL